MYYASEGGLVTGVSRAAAPLDKNTKNNGGFDYFECWGKGIDFDQVRRTNASSLDCLTSQLDQAPAGNESAANIRQYPYEARKRPWSILAKSLPFQVVWTKPYIYSSTGYTGVTVARWNGNGVFGVDITLKQFEAFMANLALSTVQIGNFGSFPAELSILRNVTTTTTTTSSSSSSSSSSSTKNEVVVSSGKDSTELITEYLKLEKVLVETTSMKSVQLFDTPWFMFVDVMQFGDQEVASGGSWNTILVCMLRRSNFLGALELSSRTLYPFIAAALIIVFIPTIGIVTRAILKVTKQKVEKKKKKEAPTGSEEEEGGAAQGGTSKKKRQCIGDRKLFNEVHRAMKLKYHIIFPIITSVLTSIVVHTSVTAPSALVVIHTFRALFATLSKCGLAYLFHGQWISTATDNMEMRFDKTTTNRIVTGILVVWILSCVANLISRASHELAPAMNTTKADAVSTTTTSYFDSALVVQTLIECLMLLSLTWWITDDIITEYEQRILAKRNRWPMRVAFALVMINSLVFTCLDATTEEQNSFSVDKTITSSSALPAYLIPIIIAVIAMSVAAKIDKPVRKNWPRPHLVPYMMTLSSIFLWMVPWITETIARYWSQLSAGAPNVSADSFLNVSSGVFAKSATGTDENFGFDLGFVVNLVWTFTVFFLSLWIHYFIEPGTLPSYAVSFEYGFTLFKSYMTALLFLNVKPLNVSFYFLVLQQCLFKVVLGLGAKNCLWDRFCSSKSWQKDFETYAQKRMNRAMKVNFTIVAPLCAKCSIIAIVLLEYWQVEIRENPAWVPPFTGGLHQLERASMAAGFVVQVAFHLLANEIIESVLSRKIMMLKHRLSTMAALLDHMGASGAKFVERTSTMKAVKGNSASRLEMGGGGVKEKNVKAEKRSSLNDGGIGAHDLLKGQLGTKWKWERHRANFFHQNSHIFLTWTAYLTIELIVHATAVSEGVRAGRVKL
jgi:hypothetical protein